MRRPTLVAPKRSPISEELGLVPATYKIQGITTTEQWLVREIADEYGRRGVACRAGVYHVRRNRKAYFRAGPLWFAQLIVSYWETGADQGDLDLTTYLRLTLEGVSR